MNKAVCPQCGSPVTSEGKFCSYCGARIPDDVFRAEIRIDNTAEIQRAQYETEESKLRQKQTEREFKARKVRWILAAIFAVLGIVLFCICLLIPKGSDHSMDVGAFMLLSMGSFALAIYICYVNLFKK